MGRELPRTVRSFSPSMQRDIEQENYELIVVDNGSDEPPREGALHAIAANLRVLSVDSPTVSPVRAVNLGLEEARGDLIGVCIDGARMASPGLLSTALAASRLHHRPVIGTLAFHLGSERQMESIKKGYNQEVEDALLARSGWEGDGYRLFDISVFAGSSSKGWFVTPEETNALFLTAPHWRELGGYDAAFECTGGGLVNLDVWHRVCEDQSGELIMLLGEATFHQVHGGVATNSWLSPWDIFHEEYVRLRGKPYAAPTRRPRFLGALHPAVAPSLLASAQTLGNAYGSAKSH